MNQYQIWKEEFALEKPKDTEVADYIEISHTEAQRLKVVAQLDPEVAQRDWSGPTPELSSVGPRRRIEYQLR